MQRLSGKKVHVYRSPHLITFNERIVVSNNIISDDDLYQLLLYVYKINNKDNITFFEFFTAAAFYIFSKVKADLFVCEVGLGGKYDATNILNEKKKSCIITSVGLDHKEYLGSSIKNIAKEKSGILGKSNLVICSYQNKKALEAIEEITKKKKCVSFIYGKDWFIKNKYLYFDNNKINISTLSLAGAHQYQNIGCAILACYKINTLNIETKLISSLIANIKWEGRLHQLSGAIKKKYTNTDFWVDCAHNTLGFKVLKKWVDQDKSSRFYLILSVGIQKDYKGILKHIKKMNPELLLLVKRTNFSSRPAEDLFSEASNLKIKCKIFNTVIQSIKFVSSIEEGLYNKKKCLIAGSINLVGEVLLKDKET